MTGARFTGAGLDDSDRDDGTLQATVPPMIAREIANRRDALRTPPGDEGARDRRPTPTPTVLAVSGGLLVAAVAVVMILWPGGYDGDQIEITGVTTTQAPSVGGVDAPSTGEPEPSPTSPPTSSSPSSSSSSSASLATGTEGGPTTAGGGTPSPESTTTSMSSSGSGDWRWPSRDGSTSTTAPSNWRGDPDRDRTWDDLAECESGGDWSADWGNGRYGGLQITASTWREYGGRGFPDQRPRDEQIEVARRIQDDLGWEYWEGCARDLGYL